MQSSSKLRPLPNPTPAQNEFNNAKHLFLVKKLGRSNVRFFSRSAISDSNENHLPPCSMTACMEQFKLTENYETEPRLPGNQFKWEWNGISSHGWVTKLILDFIQASRRSYNHFGVCQRTCTFHMYESLQSQAQQVRM